MQPSQLSQRTSPPWVLMSALRSEGLLALLFTLFLVGWEAAVLGVDYVNFFHNTTALGYQRWTASMEFGQLRTLVVWRYGCRFRASPVFC